MKFRSTLLTALTVGTLMLSACGGADEGADVVDTVATPTTIAPIEPTPEAVDIETPTVTGAEEITDSAIMTGAEGMPDAEGMTETEDSGVSDEMTGTDGMTETEDSGISAEITATGDMTDTTSPMETPDVTPGEEMTETESAGLTDTVTDTSIAEDIAVAGVVRSSELLGYGVENFEGEDLGSVNDAIVSLEQGCIDYLVLSFGGVLGLGDSLYLIPWRAVQIDAADQRLVLNVDPQVLNAAPVWDDANLPDMTAEDWDADIFGYWENVALLEPAEVDDTTTMDESMAEECAGAMTAAAADAAETTTMTETADAETSELEVQTPRVIRLSELTGYNVTNTEGEDLGEIEDLMIDWRRDQIAYAILSFGGILGLGETWFPVPLNRLTLDPIEQRLIFDVEPELLETAPGFDEATLPDTTDPSWDEEIRAFWENIQ